MMRGCKKQRGEERLEERRGLLRKQGGRKKIDGEKNENAGWPRLPVRRLILGVTSE